MLTAHIALAVVGSAVQRWIAQGCVEDLGPAVDADFDLAVDLSRDWSQPKSRRI